MTLPVSDIDSVFQSLSHYRRRLVIYYFTSETIQKDHEVAIDDLITWLATWERETRPDVADDHEQEIAHDLRHAQLPKLASAGLIEYDPDRRKIRYHGSPLLEDSIHINKLMARELGEENN